MRKQGLLNELLSPFGSLYGNWFEVQDYNNDELMEYTKEWYDGEVDLINYQLNKTADNYISLSWHLTSKEKETNLKFYTFREKSKGSKKASSTFK